MNSIYVSLVQVVENLATSIQNADLLANSSNFDNQQEALQIRLLLLILAKTLDWDVFEGDLVEGTNIGTWAELTPKIRPLLTQLVNIVNDKNPSATFEHLRVIDEQFLNEVIIRSENLVNQRALLIRVFISQLILLNIIKQKALVSHKLIGYFRTYRAMRQNVKVTSQIQIKRILHILISKNFLGDDNSQSQGLMSSFNQTFGEIIGIVTKVRDLTFSKKMLAQVMLDYPEVLLENMNFREYVSQFNHELLGEVLAENQRNMNLALPDFKFDTSNRVYNIFIDRHAKHKIFCEQVEEFSGKRLLRGIQDLLKALDSYSLANRPE